MTPLTIPISGRSSQSPPSRQEQIGSPPSTPVGAPVGVKAPPDGGGFRGTSASPVKHSTTPAPDYKEHSGQNGVESGGSNSNNSSHRSNSNIKKHNNSSNINNNNNNTVRLGSSPFWCGVSSRDPLSRWVRLFPTPSNIRFNPKGALC